MKQRPLYINGRFLTQQVTGTQRYAHEILTLLDANLVESRDGWPEVTILVPREIDPLPSYKAINIRVVGSYRGRLWEQLELPFYSWRGVLFTPCGGAPLVHPRNVITIHDAGVFANPDAYSISFRLWYRFLYRALCRTSLHVLTVSKTSKSELEWYAHANPNKVSVTYLGAEHATRSSGSPETLERHNLKPFGYVFTVSTRSANKNIGGVLRAMELADKSLKLVMAGRRNLSVFGDQAVLPPEVIDLGYVSDDELRVLNENAACFVFPSFYEGFGLPPLEAMAVGCPVVTSNTSALAELFSTIAFLCDPADPEDIAARIAEACASGPEYRESCKGFASLFTWERCAQKTWGLLAKLCAVEEKTSQPGPIRLTVGDSQINRARIHGHPAGLARSR